LNDHGGKAGASDKSGVMFPNGYFDLTAYRMNNKTSEKISLSSEEQAELAQGKAYLAVYGHAEYLDSSGIVHWTKFCDWQGFDTRVSYTAQECTYYNDTDDNK
jgi:hypothetical protein